MGAYGEEDQARCDCWTFRYGVGHRWEMDSQPTVDTSKAGTSTLFDGSAAQLYGSWVSDASITPRTFLLQDRRITIAEAWLERRQVGHSYVWFPRYYYYLCFRLQEGEELFHGANAPGFILEKSDREMFFRGVDSGPWGFWDRIEDDRAEQKILILGKDRKRVGNLVLTATRREP